MQNLKLQSNRIGLFIVSMLILWSLHSCQTGKSQQYNIQSPNDEVSAQLLLDKGEIKYQVSYQDKALLKPSKLGLTLSNDKQLTKGFELIDVSESNHEGDWRPVWGTESKIDNNFNEMVLKLEQTSSPNLRLHVIIRAYNNGVGVRYRIPEQPNLDSFTITSEETTIEFSHDNMCYALHRDHFQDNYERTFDKTILSELSPKSLIGLPLLVKAKNCWVSVTEANLTDFAGVAFTKDPDNDTKILTKLAPYPDNKNIKVKGAAPHVSPWRVFMIEKQAGDLIESNLIFNLNDKNALKETQWIKPGKVTWPWWNGRIAQGKSFSGTPGTELHKYYIDFAARNDIPYLVVDAGWYSTEDDAWDQPEKENILTIEETRKDRYDVKEIIKYGQEKGVDVMLWMQIGSMMTKEKVDNILSTVADWGAKGIKIDYYGGEYQELVNHIHYIIKTAAKHKLLVDYHGAYKPTGIHRTYPNYMTSEAVLGLEHSKWSQIPKSQHNVTIPFTRMLGGPMDYTPGAFDLDGTEDNPKYVQTTRAHQMAMYVVYFSPVQMLVDYPNAYEQEPELFEFIKEVPVTWDDTKCINGYPGDYLAVARKKNTNWFVGIMNDEDEGRNITIPCAFLNDQLTYKATIYEDAEDASVNPEHVTIKTQKITASDSLSFSLPSDGGAALMIKPE